jgi:hypothetical protein
MSPNFSVATFQIEEYNPHAICMTYKFKNEKKSTTKELFKIGSTFPATKSIVFENRAGGIDLLIHYSDKVQLMRGLPTQIA